MRLTKKLTCVFAVMLTLSMVLSACQVPEGVEIPSGVSIPSDLSDLTSEEQAQLESVLEGIEDSVEGKSEEVSESEDVQGDEVNATDDVLETTDIMKDTEAVKTTVNLASGRGWVHKILNVEEYRKAYPDLQKAFGDNWDAYVDHYLTYGLYEGRDEGKLFDPWVYAESYPDVKAAYGDDVNAIIAHYVNHGINEGKTAGTSAGYVDMADKVSREYMMSHDVVAREPSTRIEALLAVADNVMRYGRNLEGAKYPQLIVDGIDPVTKEAVIWNKFTNDKSYVSNLYGQSNLLKMLEGLTLITGDQRYQDLAYDQIRIRYNTPGLVDENGLFYAGGHTVTDIMDGKQTFLYHETKDYQLPVDMYYRVDPEGFRKYVTAYWNAHIYDPSCLIMNRHGYYDTPLQNGDFWSSEYTNPDPYVESWTAPFLCTAHDMMELAYYLTYATGDPTYRAWADRLLDKYLAVSNEETGLMASQYGVMVDEETGVRDRWLYNFAGADFVDASGNDYKTLTEWDSARVGETQMFDRGGSKSIQGYGTQTYIYLYELTGSEKFYNAAKSNMLGYVRYAYDAQRHLNKTPMGIDGTDFNPGEGNGPILIAPRGGYYRSAGMSFAESESVHELVFKSMIDVVNLLREDDPAASAEIWAAARAWAGSSGLGDIGTYLGENVNVNLNTTNRDPFNTLAVVSLYKYTGNQQYYDLAVVMADNILRSVFNEEIGLFGKSTAPYLKFDTEAMYAVFCVEAMAAGILDQISMDMSHSGPDLAHDGMGQVNDEKVFYARSKVKVKKVDLGSDNYSLILNETPNIEIKDIYGHRDEKAIRQMVSVGLMGVDAEGNFMPDTTLTHAQLSEIVVNAFGLENKAALDAILGTVPFDTNGIATKEELAYILVKTLQNALPEKEFYIANALYRITDADTISDWAKDYADIATNYRLMVDIEEDVFMPKAEVTKACVANALQNIYRYIPVKGVQKLNAVVSPYNADSQIISWETSDATILEIDEQGRLYPLKAGTVTVTATADKKRAEIEVTVAEKEGWMIQNIYIDGETLEDFSPTVHEYAVNLHLGTSQVPFITATSFSGAPVEIIVPDSLPGRVELKVQGFEKKYIIDMDNSFVDYIVDENFNHKIGTPIENLKSDRFNIYINGDISLRYKSDWKVIPRNWVRQDYEGYGCMAFPYRHAYNGTAALNLRLNTEDGIVFGPEQDDMLVVIEVEFAVKNLEGKRNGFELMFSENMSTGTSSFARFYINDKNEIIRRKDRTLLSKETRRKLQDEQFYTLRLILNKKDGSFDYYLNEELIEKNIPAFHDFCPGFETINFYVAGEEQACNAEMFFDNVKIYELQKCVVEERFEQELAPATPKPTYTPYILDEKFDGFAVGTQANKLESEFWTSFWGTSYHHNRVTVVPADGTMKRETSATDNALEFKPTTNLEVNKHGMGFQMKIPEERWYPLGVAGTENRYAVIEMDLAITGLDGQTASEGYHVRIGGNGNFSLANFRLYAGYLGRNIDSSRMTQPNEKNAYIKGDVAHLTWVLDKETKRYVYFWNGVLVEENVLAQYPNEADTPAIKYIAFNTPLVNLAYGVESFDEVFYVDNVKVYETDRMLTPTPAPTRDPALPTPVPTAGPTEEPTPAPTGTPQPTYHPVIIEETFDGFEEGTLLKYVSGDTWSGTWGISYHHEKGSVVSKTAVDVDALASDRLIKIGNVTNLDANRHTPTFYMKIADYKWYPLGVGDVENKYAVLEMDIMLHGTDGQINPNGYRIRIGGDGNFRLVDFKLYADYLGRYIDSSTVTKRNGKNVYTKGQVGHLKWILDKATKRYSYYWNDVLVEENVKAQYSGTETSAIKYLMFTSELVTLPDGVGGIDEALYVDNVRLYEVNEFVAPTPVPTAMPTAEPTPAPTTTGAPTATPTMAPTAAPTETPADNGVIVDETFDGRTVGTMSHQLSGTYWNGKWGVSYNHELGVVVARAGAGNWLEISPTVTGAERYYDSPWNIKINEEKWLALGSAVPDQKYLVFEVELMLAGNDALQGDIAIRLGGDGNFALTNFKLNTVRMGRHIDSSTVTALRGDGKNAYTQGRIANLKWVLDRETKQYTWYWNGVLVEENINAQFRGATETPALKYIAITMPKQTLAEGQSGVDTKLYVDHVKLYTTDTK